jgi:hypothetical protein
MNRRWLRDVRIGQAGSLITIVCYQHRLEACPTESSIAASLTAQQPVSIKM